MVEFNTTYQQVQVASGEGFQFYIWDPSGAQGTQVSPTFAYNTMIANPTQGTSYVPGGINIAMSYLLHGTSGAQFPTAITGTASIHDNYFDASGAYGIFYPNTFNGWSLYNNYNMATGTLLPGTTGSTPAAPTITAFSPDTGVAGDGITNANVLTITGAAVASSTVTLYDGSVLLGTATANTSGAWSLVTAALANGAHSFTATDTVSGATSAASAALAVSVDTVAPAAPVISGDAVVNTNEVALSGTALTDTVSGATSAASAALSVTVDTVAPAAPVISSDAVVNTALSGTALDQGVAEISDRAMLGPNAIPAYHCYDPAVKPTITEEFEGAAYRFGHSIVEAAPGQAQLVIGSKGNDTLSGGELSDTLVATLEHMTMTGGAGDDTFVFNTDQPNPWSGRQRHQDHSANSKHCYDHGLRSSSG